MLASPSSAGAGASHRPARSIPVPLPGLVAGVVAASPPQPQIGLSAVPAVEVTGVTADSRLVVPGDLYVALAGRTVHGSRFAAAAVHAGAQAVLTDAAGAWWLADHHPGVPVVKVSDPRLLVAPLAARLYGYPSQRMTMLGITGTNGKTTTSFLIEAGLRAAGYHAGLVGTLGYRLDGAAIETVRTTVTTPEAAEVQALLALLAERGADTVVMEVSSHALSLGRVDEICFDVAAFTNFGRDHLDFHGSEEEYFAAKTLLFGPERSRSAVVNIDDAHGRRLAEELTARGAPWVGTSLRRDGDAAYRPRQVQPRSDGSTAVTAVTPGGSLNLVVGLPGDFNLHNALTAVAVLDRAGVDLAAAVPALAAAAVPGRMQRVQLGEDAPAAYVDFAHTPQAIAAVLRALRSQAGSGRLVCVLGCGGDRDPAKRGPMGKLAVELADVLVATDDNPRSEDPAAIRADLLAGARAAVRAGELGTEVRDGGDRAAAIATALELAGPGDVVAVLGKGHEQGQEVAGQVLPFSDEQALREAWAAGAKR